MAEAATIVQLSGAACTVVELIWRAVREVREAEEHVRKLERELRHTKHVLESTSTVLGSLDDGESSSEQRHSPLADLRGALKDLTEAIERVRDGDGVHKMKWLRNARTCGKLTEEVRTCRDMIVDRFLILQCSPTKDSANSSFPSLIRMTQREGQMLAIDPSQEDTAPSTSLLQVAQAGPTTSRRHSTGLISGANVAFDVKHIGPQLPNDDESCVRGCRCTCHYAHARRKSTQSIRASIAPSASRLGYGTFTRKCSVPECTSKRSPRGQLTYSFPSRLLHKIITISILYKDLRFRSYLDIPTYVPDFSDCVRAAVTGDLPMLRRLFATGLARKNDTGLDGWTLLHNAAYNGRTAVVEFLLDHKADRDAVEINNRKASHFAMIKALKTSATDEARELVALFGEEVKQLFRDDFRLTPIHACVLHLQDENDQQDGNMLARLLQFVKEANAAPVDQDWSLFSPTITDRTPLFIETLEIFRGAAARQQASNKSGTKVFLDLRNQPDAHGWTPLHWAAYAGRFDEVKTLLEFDATTIKLTTSRRNVLHHAAESGNGDLLRYVFENRDALYMSTMKIDQQDLWDETPLHIAATRSADCVACLVDHDARMDLVQADNQTALHFASQAPDSELQGIVYLLTERCEALIKMKDQSGRTPIFDLLRSPDCVQLLLNRNADTNIRDHKKRSLLHEACSKGYDESLELLLSRCEKRLINRKDADGFTPLAHAFACCTPGSARCAALILARKDITIDPKSDKAGWSAIHHAAKLGSLEVLELVLKRFNTGDLIGQCKESLEQIVLSGLGSWEGDFKLLLEDFERKERAMGVGKEQSKYRGELYENIGNLMG